MTTTIWPNTSGDVVLDLREVLSDGVLRPALVAVDESGAELPFGKIVEVRDGGGHVELTRFLVAHDIGFDTNESGSVLIHPENV
jgi:hypothetical protein